MAIIKCKMCGGDIELSDDKTFGVCEYCGSTMTLPKISDEQRAAAFNRGNYFRRIGEFDQALELYEQIVRENDTDAEAHWCCALCRYGIEYVEDPETLEWLPTCQRASFDSFVKDIDYLAALEHSDGITRRQYQKEAAKIEEVRRGILVVSQNETPFDVFLCYKESDDNGERTIDSTLAQDIYYRLTEQGWRVFFARITLEDKVGAQYEPYIFAALHSAKIMVVIGTRPDYLNSVWVKNEWSRFLYLMKQDKDKLLLPCYRDMDPYDLPEPLSVLQSFDMAKIGFIQDLLRGIGKVLDIKKQDSSVKHDFADKKEDRTAALLKRGNLALEDQDWIRADNFFEQVLNYNPECAEAYLGKELAADKCTNLNQFVTAMLEATNEAPYLNVTINVTDENRIRSIVEQYKVDEFLPEEKIRMELYYSYTEYRTAVPAREKQYRQVQEKFKHSKLLGRAIGFSKDSLHKSLLDAQKLIYAEMERRLNQARQDENEAVKLIKNNYKIHLDRTEKRIEIMYQEALENKKRSEIEREDAREKAFFKARQQKKGVVFLILIIVFIVVIFKLAMETPIV